MDWVDLVQDKEHGNEPSGSNAGKFLSGCTIGSFLRRNKLRK
jgi:hypothetical protein